MRRSTLLRRLFGRLPEYRPRHAGRKIRHSSPVLDGLVALENRALLSATVMENQILSPATPAAALHFGADIDVSGTEALVGIANGSQNTNTGATLFAFQNGQWSVETQLTPTSSFNAGDRVAFSGDNAAVFEGASSNITMFRRTNGTWSQVQKLTSPDSGFPYGETLALSGDDLVVGEQIFLSGRYRDKYYVYHFDGASWTGTDPVLLDLTADGGDDKASIAIAGDTIVAGLGDPQKAVVFTRTPGMTDWTRGPTIANPGSGPFGTSVAVSDDQSTIVVGSPDNGAPTAHAYVFVKDGSNWTQQGDLTPSDTPQFSNFGLTVDVAGDTVVVGAKNANEAYVYKRSGTTWTEAEILTASDGASNDLFGVAVGVTTGGQALVGSFAHSIADPQHAGQTLAAAGAVYAYDTLNPPPPPPFAGTELGYALQFKGSGADEIERIVTDADGNVYVAGRVQGSGIVLDPVRGTTVSSSGTIANLLVAKYNSDGGLMWSKLFTGDATATGLGVDGDGNVYVGGNFKGAVTFNAGTTKTAAAAGSVFVSKLNSDGSFGWVDAIAGVSLGGLAVGAAGGPVVTGNYSGTIDFDPGVAVSNLTAGSASNAYVLSLNDDGTFGWVKGFAGAGIAQGTAVALDSSGNVYATGVYAKGAIDLDPGAGTVTVTKPANQTGADAYIVKLDTDGAYQWSHLLTGSVLTATIAVDADGFVYVGGGDKSINFDPGNSPTTITSKGVGDGFVVSLDPAGAFNWFKILGGSAGSAAGVAALTLTNDSVYVLSDITGSKIDIDPSVTGQELINTSAGDMLIWKLDHTGKRTYAQIIGGAGTEIGLSIAADGTGGVYTGGLFKGVADFDPTADEHYNLTALGTSDGFLLKLDESEPPAAGVVSIVATTPLATELNAVKGVFTFTRTGLKTQPLVVHYSVLSSDPKHPTAAVASSDDYQPISGTVTIPAGKTSVTLNIVPIDDGVAEPTERLTLSLDADPNYIVDLNKSVDTVGIADNSPVASIKATDAKASESGTAITDTAKVTLSLSKPPPATLPVMVQIDTDRVGSADFFVMVNGVHQPFTLGQPFAVTFPKPTSGAAPTSITIDIRPIDDGLAEPLEFVTVSLVEGDGYNVGGLNQASVAIADNEPLVSVSNTSANQVAAEVRGGSGAAAKKGTFTISRAAPAGASTPSALASAVDVFFTLDSNNNGSPDFLLFDEKGNQVTDHVHLNAGQASINLTVSPLDDTTAEGFNNPEFVVLTLADSPTTAYTVNGPKSAANVQIVDNEPLVTVKATKPAAAEGGADGVITITREKNHPGVPGVQFDNTRAIDVDFTLDGAATRNTDYVILDENGNVVTTSSLHFAANQIERKLTVRPLDDAIVDDGETVIFNLTKTQNANYNVNQIINNSATVTIADNEPVVGIQTTGVDHAAAESSGVKNSALFKIVRSQVSQAITVHFTLHDDGLLHDDQPRDYTLVINGTPVTTTENDATYAVNIPAGKDSVLVEVIPIDDSVVETTVNGLGLSNDLEDVILTLADNNNRYQFHPAPPFADSDSITIQDNEPVVMFNPLGVLFGSIGGDASETTLGTDTGAVFVSRTTDDNALPVSFSVSGTATPEVDYTLAIEDANTKTIVPLTPDNQGHYHFTFPAHTKGVFPASKDLAIIVVPIDDHMVETDETVLVHIDDSNAYFADNDAGTLPDPLGDERRTVTIHDNEPVVGVQTSDKTAAESGSPAKDAGVFKITRSQTDQAITVHFDLHDNNSRLDNGEARDYTLLINGTPVTPTSNDATYFVNIPAGTASVDVKVLPVDDSFAESSETVTLTLVDNANRYIFTPALPFHTSDSLTIADNEPVVSFTTATSPNTREPSNANQNNTGFIDLKRTNTDAPLDVVFKVDASSTATYGSDFIIKALVGSDFTEIVPDGQGRFTVHFPSKAQNSITSGLQILEIVPLQDGLVESDEKAVLHIESTEFYTADNTTTATNRNSVTILDESPTVSFAALSLVSPLSPFDPSSSEKASGEDVGRMILARKDGDTSLQLTVPLIPVAGAGQATPDVDYTVTTLDGTPVPFDGVGGVYQFTFAPGVTSVFVVIHPITDGLTEGDELVTFNLNNSNQYISAAVGTDPIKHLPLNQVKIKSNTI